MYNHLEITITENFYKYNISVAHSFLKSHKRYDHKLYETIYITLRKTETSLKMYIEITKYLLQTYISPRFIKVFHRNYRSH